MAQAIREFALLHRVCDYRLSTGFLVPLGSYGVIVKKIVNQNRPARLGFKL
jgi:hypothetical protein